MAGDWIKMRTSLHTNPKVNGITKLLETSPSVGKALGIGVTGSMSEIVTRNVMRHVTVSSLLLIWGAANEHTKFGVFVNSELTDIDDMTGIPGFGEALAAVGWAEYDAHSNVVTLPNFNEYNTSGKERTAVAKTGAERQKDYRDRKKLQGGDVTGDVTCNRRLERRRGEKVIEEESPSLLSGDSAAKPQRTSSRKKREEVTLATYLETCKAAGVKPVPDDHPIRVWCHDAKITVEMLQVGWVVFREKYLSDEKLKGKRYKDWAGHFANSVKGRWYSLWFTGEDGAPAWTSTGLLRKQVLEAQHAKTTGGAV